MIAPSPVPPAGRYPTNRSTSGSWSTLRELGNHGSSSSGAAGARCLCTRAAVLSDPCMS